jgi:hypothetical protein
LQSEELWVLYSPNIIPAIKSRTVRWVGITAVMRQNRNACTVLAGKPEGKRPLRRPRHRWEDLIKMKQ